jgi:hypothetical protein
MYNTGATAGGPTRYMLFENTEVVSGMTATSPGVTIGATGPGYTGATGTVLTFGSTGTYNIQFSAQLDKTDGGDDNVNIWPIKGGVAVPWSNTKIIVQGPSNVNVAAWNYMFNFNKDETFQLAWQSPDAAMRIIASGATGARPETPSVILTAQKVSN